MMIKSICYLFILLSKKVVANKCLNRTAEFAGNMDLCQGSAMFNMWLREWNTVHSGDCTVVLKKKNTVQLTKHLS